MRTDLFDYELPAEFIAQQPADLRDGSKLLILHRATGHIEHRIFNQIGDYLRAGDLLVANNSRVIPARLRGHKATGGQVEVFLLRQIDDTALRWECLVRGRNLIVGTEIRIDSEEGRESAPDSIRASVEAVNTSGTRDVLFSRSPLGAGEIPLPPYITDYQGDEERYQTVYSQPEGSAAAPTAGLHFTPELLLELNRRGIPLEHVTLHVGLDTFRPRECRRDRRS